MRSFGKIILKRQVETKYWLEWLKIEVNGSPVTKLSYKTYLLRKERYLQIRKFCGGEIKGALSEQKKSLSPRAGKGFIIYT